MAPGMYSIIHRTLHPVEEETTPTPQQTAFEHVYYDTLSTPLPLPSRSRAACLCVQTKKHHFEENRLEMESTALGRLLQAVAERTKPTAAQTPPPTPPPPLLPHREHNEEGCPLTTAPTPPDHEKPRETAVLVVQGGRGERGGEASSPSSTEVSPGATETPMRTSSTDICGVEDDDPSSDRRLGVEETTEKEMGGGRVVYTNGQNDGGGNASRDGGDGLGGSVLGDVVPPPLLPPAVVVTVSPHLTVSGTTVSSAEGDDDVNMF